MSRFLLIAIIANVVWINAATVFRYFLFVRPMLREAQSSLPDVAAMSLPVFLGWGGWILIPVLSVSLLSWFVMRQLGAGLVIALMSGTAVWAMIHASLWTAMHLMQLAPVALVTIVLPLTWIEMAVASLIVRWALARDDGDWAG